MTVPSKSKKAPTRGPCGPASTSAISCSSVQVPTGRSATGCLVGAHGSTRHALPRRARRRARRSRRPGRPRRGPARPSPAGAGPAPRRPGSTRSRFAASFSAAGEQLPRQRLRPVQAPLQQHLLADAAALVQELRLDHRPCAGPARRAARPRPAARRRTTAAPGGPPAAAPAHSTVAAVGGLPVRVAAARARREHLLPVGVPLGEEELELQLVAQPHRLVPAVGRVVAASPARRSPGPRRGGWRCCGRTPRRGAGRVRSRRPAPHRRRRR